VDEGAVVNLRYVAGLRRGWIVICLPLLAMALAVVWTARQDSTYASTTTLLVTQLASGGAPRQVHDIPASEELARTYGRLVVTSPVLEQVIQELRLDLDVRQLKGQIDVSVGTASQLIEIRAEAPSPRRAETLAAVLAGTFIASRTADRARGARVTLAEPAQPAEEVGPNLLASVLLAGVFGCALAFGLVVVRERFLQPIDDPHRLEEAVGVRVLATIPKLRPGFLARARSTFHRASSMTPESEAAARDAELEPYRLLRTVVDGALAQSQQKLILVSSPEAGDGVSTTVANLAVAFAQLGRRVLVIDCNLRWPTQHGRFGLDNDVGFAEVLENGRASKEIIREGPEGVSLVSAGHPSKAPGDLIPSRATRAILRSLSTPFDLVLLDVPPVDAVDTRILGRLVDRVLMVVDPRLSSVPAVERALDLMDRERVLGVVLNRAGHSRSTAGWTREREASTANRERPPSRARPPSDVPAAAPQTASQAE
jgi:tyrosine-protein kinase